MSDKITSTFSAGSSIVYTIKDEDHTLGNILRSSLLQQPGVNVAAYRIPHPLEKKMTVTISTNGTVTPPEALNRTIDELALECDSMETSFMQSLKEIQS